MSTARARGRPGATAIPSTCDPDSGGYIFAVAISPSMCQDVWPQAPRRRDNFTHWSFQKPKAPSCPCSSHILLSTMRKAAQCKCALIHTVSHSTHVNCDLLGVQPAPLNSLMLRDGENGPAIIETQSCRLQPKQKLFQLHCHQSRPRPDKLSFSEQTHKAENPT